MNKVIRKLLIAALPAIALAACGEPDAHDADIQVAGDSTQATKQHDHDSEHDKGHTADGHEPDDSMHATEQHGHESHDMIGHDDDNHKTGGSNQEIEQQNDHPHAGMDHHNHASATGSPGNRENIKRTVELAMDDSMRFTPNRLTFDAGETVRFVVRNNGKIPHEFVIGSMSELKEHAEMMRAMPTMQHAEANMLTLAAGAEGEVLWHFDEPGTVDFACLIPGHLEAGMKGVIEVE